MQDRPVALIMQDTTELDFSKHPRQDMGVLDEKYRRGLDDHPPLAVAAGVSAGLRVASRHSGQQIVSVADREGDQDEIFLGSLDASPAVKLTFFWGRPDRLPPPETLSPAAVD